MLARVGALLAPPERLLDRVCWIVLLFSLLMAAVVFGLVVRSVVTPLALRLAALSAIVELVWWWIRGYWRGGFPSLVIVFEWAAVFAAALTTGVPPTAFGLPAAASCSAPSSGRYAEGKIIYENPSVKRRFGYESR